MEVKNHPLNQDCLYIVEASSRSPAQINGQEVAFKSFLNISSVP